MLQDPKRPLPPLLQRQLKRLGIDPEGAEPLAEPWGELVRQVARTYHDHDENRYLLERSLELSSSEMNVLNTRLAEERRRLAGELDIARSLQTSILPRNVHTESYEAVAGMVPASEVGGDYYDVIAVDGGCWIAIGDVAGHGLRAAVIMTMVQSMVAVLLRQMPNASPRDMVIALNRAVHDNVFQRLAGSDHVTLTMLRCGEDGEVAYAGAHEPILVQRAGSGRCETFETDGTWLGPIADISPFTFERKLRLDRGDTMILHTDGVTEARAASGELFGWDRFVALMEESHDRSAAEVCERTLAAVDAWADVQTDDVTILAYRRLGG